MPRASASSDDKAPRVRLSVLDRLVGSDAEPGDVRTGTIDDVERLVRRDLEWLLSTRRAPNRADALPEGRTVTEYGLPDFSPVSPADQEALRSLAYEVRTTIEAFEPRLRDVAVRVEPVLEPGRVTAIVEAMLAVGEARRPVSFPFAIRTRG